MSAPLIRQVAHTCIFAHDIEATEIFYRDIFGVTPRFYFHRKGRKFGHYFDMGGRTFIEVFEKAESRFADTDQINHICLEAVDLDHFIMPAPTVSRSPTRCWRVTTHGRPG